jgi:hypothetical protein
LPRSAEGGREACLDLGNDCIVFSLVVVARGLSGDGLQLNLKGGFLCLSFSLQNCELGRHKLLFRDPLQLNQILFITANFSPTVFVIASEKEGEGSK